MIHSTLYGYFYHNDGVMQNHYGKFTEIVSEDHAKILTRKFAGTVVIFNHIDTPNDHNLYDRYHLTDIAKAYHKNGACETQEGYKFDYVFGPQYEYDKELKDIVIRNFEMHQEQRGISVFSEYKLAPAQIIFTDKTGLTTGRAYHPKGKFCDVFMMYDPVDSGQYIDPPKFVNKSLCLFLNNEELVGDLGKLSGRLFHVNGANEPDYPLMDRFDMCYVNSFVEAKELELKYTNSTFVPDGCMYGSSWVSQLQENGKKLYQNHHNKKVS